MEVELSQAAKLKIPTTRWSPSRRLNTMVIKRGHLKLSLLIPWKHKVKHMDVYLELVIDELEELWRGVAVVGISRPPSSLHECV